MSVPRSAYHYLLPDMHLLVPVFHVTMCHDMEIQDFREAFNNSSYVPHTVKYKTINLHMHLFHA